ncbi:YbaY family lipoprotein [Sulfitobacter sp. M220]|uniref:YbaY family lipoprotein n=1 Tax=Sulfitobacter sp. M220 TaxID=2675333 RepID=UPI001F17AF25|nr:YbaY family lipoprotein [Sulfitobacter sp. M220]
MTGVAAADDITISGTFAYRERIATPPDATAQVVLQDVSRADAPSVVLARHDIDLNGDSPPFSYSMTVDQDELDARMRYAVQIQIRGRNDRLLWITDTAYLIDPSGGNQELDPIMLVRVAEPGTNDQDEPMDSVATGRTSVFVCTNAEGERFSLRTKTGPGELAVWLPDRFMEGVVTDTYQVLGQVRAASGAKYQSEDVMVWNKGDEAMLVVAGTSFRGCTLDPAAAVQEDTDLRAIGQEPGWTLEIQSGDRITFVHDYGAQQVVVPAPEPESDPSGTVTYHARTEAHDLSVTLESHQCTDSMSGETFPISVAVTLDETVYHGCGRELR